MTLAITLRFVLQGNPFPAWYVRVLETLTNYPISTPRVDLLSITIAIMVIVVHAFRRILECLFVSVYSKSNMHVAHYLAGIFFYSLQGFSIIGEGPQVHSEGVPHTMSEMMKNLRVNHIVGVLVFLWASWHHHRAHEIFASLRSTAKDVNRHMIPRGDWFEYVSCPHYLAEILIYISLGLILGPAQQTWWLVLAFVVSNQTAASLEVHRWYRAKFEDYPKDRKAFIPFIL
ncbi:polyprenal reductase-like [Diadema antillarum]|uniref:polyprenal reductase-like n=1 Tax=Diadema antillarum TaxID=105358 RepID=UPI003A884271